jgi:DNA-binding CsgD family transcriptional regulator
MDFLSTPLPVSTGTEENFVYNPYRVGGMWGLKQSPEHTAKISKPKYVFQGKSAGDWAKILGGDYGVIRHHIKNGTMEQYKTYCKWANIPCTAINKNLKIIYKGKAVKEWVKILGGDRGTIRHHIKNGTMHEYRTYCKWANIPYTKKTVIKHYFQGKTVKQWAKILGGDPGTIRKNMQNGTMERYIEKKTG